ncbi:hypothetical protein AKJ09_03738 [Labilithrix luteola]|uniref:TonB C-terminal domain-containing protein n=1 Tax=Labilithrix luteola TaxID=1391654 RepID=A0A0K1PVC0_9BACT|nr:AgmX/PglI C-terminal domain-containing protein [Labilithrix luteola]AKU97074.1 hypothetical protein AKJ09_03738 [Labilithrix luteola]
MNGPLPSNAVKRVVRARFGLIGACYEQALGKYGTPFDGRVTVKFVVDASGTSTMIEDGGSDVPAGEMVPCVLAQFEKLSFSKPVGKVATVVYPVVFEASR